MRFTLGFAIFNRPDKVIGFDNIPKKGPFVIVANHISHLDHFFIGAKVIERTDQKVHYIAKPRYWQWYGAQKIADYTGTIIYNETNKKESINKAIKILKRGGIIAIFPEGTRNFHHELLRGHTGVARLVLGAKVPIVPVGYFGPHTYTAWDTIKHLYLLEAKIKIVFGKPIYYRKYYDQPIDKKLLKNVTDEIMHEVSKVCGKPYLYN